MNDKSAVIFMEIGEVVVPKLLIADGDLRYLDGYTVNATGTPDEISDRICKIFYKKDGMLIHDEVSPKKFADEVKQGAYVVRVGFIC